MLNRPFVAGHEGAAGSAILRALAAAPEPDAVASDAGLARLLDGAAIDAQFSAHRPTCLVDAVPPDPDGPSGPAREMDDLMRAQRNLLAAASRFGVQSYLLVGASDQGGRWYRAAREAGLHLLHAWQREYGIRALGVIPDGLCGWTGPECGQPHGQVSVLIRDFHRAHRAGAREIGVAGDPRTPCRFLHCDDLAHACLALLRGQDNGQTILVSPSAVAPLGEAAALVARSVGFAGEIRFGSAPPAAMPAPAPADGGHRVMRWKPGIGLEAGIRDLYRRHLTGGGGTGGAEAGTGALLREDKLVTPAGVLARTREWRAAGRVIGFTNGCFDVLHAGHVSLLRQARAACHRLVVGLNDDASVSRLKGAGRPVNPVAQRVSVLRALGDVDAVVVFAEDTPERLIRTIRPDVLVKGADYAPDSVVGADFVRASGGRILLARLEPGLSSSRLIERLRASSDQT